MAVDVGWQRQVIVVALAVLAVVWFFRLSIDNEAVFDRTKSLVDDVSVPWLGDNPAKPPQPPPPTDHTQEEEPATEPPAPNAPLGEMPSAAKATVGRVTITDRVAVITDSQYTNRLVPLIMHYHTVLGPGWPIVFYTTQEVIDKLQAPSSSASGSGPAVWQRAVDMGAIELRLIPSGYDLSNRTQVNMYLSRPWLWEALAPADKVLVFQSDAVLCANSRRTIDSFLHWDMNGAWLNTREYNGGLSLRNRTALLDILAGSSWEAEVAAGTWDPALGEDVWFSRMLQKADANLPDQQESLDFSVEFEWQVQKSKKPLGYHKVHKNVKNKDLMAEIAEWCPEIAFAMAGSLEG